jgi:hypothetical protein
VQIASLNMLQVISAGIFIQVDFSGKGTKFTFKFE